MVGPTDGAAAGMEAGEMSPPSGCKCNNKQGSWKIDKKKKSKNQIIASLENMVTAL